ncbi:hypothetical protein [Streptomyces aureus]|uniref:hypothetical protein n=1 Tax=Streptomyces aureus TaxID=193461 RepID=UPI00131DEC5D|nr:hypothetical protein [Streptomyces aureus]
MDASDDGRKLDPERVELGTNPCGVLLGCRDAFEAARYFVRPKRNSRSSSCRSYEAETDWCQMEVVPIEDPNLPLNGGLAPKPFDELDGVLRPFGPRYSLEPYEGDGTLVHGSRA